MFKAALFDMDGLLFDTGALHAKVLAALGPSFNIEITYPMLLDMLGANETACSRYLLDRFPFLDTEKLWEVFHQALKDYVAANGMPMKPYAAEILHQLRANGLKTALVTSSQTTDVTCYMKASGFQDCFDAFVTGDMGLPSKPAPDVYRRAAELLGVKSADCVVLEDSPFGLKSGRDAGAYTIMVPDLKPYIDEYASFTDCVVPTLKEAYERILKG